MSIPLRVLVIQSSEADALLYLGELHGGGYEVLYERISTRGDLAAALDVSPWEAVLASTDVPGLPWLHAFDELRVRDLETPFLLIAPDPFDRDAAVQAMQAGVHDYIQRSDLGRLIPALERALREAGIRREWREAELVVRESEERFRLLVEGVRDYALFMLDTDGRVASWNAGAQRLHGYFAAEIIGQHYTCFYPDEDADQAAPEEDLEQAFRKGRIEKEGWRVRKDGSRFWAHVIITALNDDRGRLRGFSKLTRDITERKRVELALAERAEELSRSEDALQKHTRILRSVLDSMGEGVVVCDEEGSLLLFNPAAQQMLGATLFTSAGDEPTADYGLYLPDTMTPFPEEDLPINRAIRGESIDGGEIFVRDGRGGAGKYMNVTARPLRDEEGRARGGVAVFRDTTGQRNAQTALQRAQRELREVIEKIPDGVGICREGRFVYVNPAFATCLGYASPEELAGKPLLDHVDEADREKAAARMQGITAPESARAPGEFRYLRKDGGIVTLEVAPVQSLEFEGAPAYLFVARDVTEQKKMQARLLLTDRMASVGTLAAGVAHEINNPLAYVIANVELVAGELMALGLDVPALLSPLPESQARGAAEERIVGRLREMEQTLHEAQEGTERVRQITRDLKTFSRADEELRSAVDVTRVLDASINMAWNEIRHRARLVKDYGRVPRVEANEARIGQVFLNLLINAAQAIPEGAADKNEIHVSARMEGLDRVRVDVKDTGSGIPEESMSRIFDPFFTTKPVGVGTGLGLSICHGIVTQLGGEILVKSEVGRGSVFSVVLRASRSAGVSKPPPEPVPTGRRGRVLVVDDEAMIGTAIRRTLSSEHDVVPLTSAREALDRIIAGDRFDVVLCDLMMPVMSGMDLYEELSRLAPDQAKRVVFLTGGAFTQRGQEFLDQVPNPRLDKPFDNQNLRSIVRERVRWQDE